MAGLENRSVTKRLWQIGYVSVTTANKLIHYLFDLQSGSEVEADVKLKRSQGYNRYFCASARRRSSLHRIVLTRPAAFRILTQVNGA